MKYLMAINKQRLHFRHSVGKINAIIDRVDVNVEAMLHKSVEHVHAPPALDHHEILKIQNCTKFIVHRVNLKMCSIHK